MSLKSLPSNPAFSSPQPLADGHASTTANTNHVTPPELEQTLALLTSHRSVLGYMVLSRGQPVTIIKHSGVVFEGEQGKKYAQAVGRIVESVQVGLEEVAGDSGEVDDIRFMRIRTKRHEIMISPDARYLLAVLHDPTP